MPSPLLTGYHTDWDLMVGRIELRDKNVPTYDPVTPRRTCPDCSSPAARSAAETPATSSSGGRFHGRRSWQPSPTLRHHVKYESWSLSSLKQESPRRLRARYVQPECV